MVRLGTAIARLVLVAMVLVFALNGAARADTRRCRDLPRAAFAIQATNLGCQPARRVVRRWSRAYLVDGKTDRFVDSFFCREKVGRNSNRIRCGKGRERVSFIPIRRPPDDCPPGTHPSGGVEGGCIEGLKVE